MSREAAAKAALHAAHAGDPTTVPAGEGDGDGEVPLEVALSEAALRWLARLDPGASDLRQLAVNAHHLRRWEVPRGSYPEGRAGYLRWRTDQKRRHAEDLATILAEAGYETGDIERVQAIVRKEGLASDPEVQVHEDAICLAFLEVQLDRTLDQMGAERLVPVLRKTAAKMSSVARELIAEVPLSDRGRAVLEQALTG